MSDARGERLLDISIGVALALLLVAGRTSLSRLIPSVMDAAWLEPRWWSCAWLVVACSLRVAAVSASARQFSAPPLPLFGAGALLALLLTMLASALWGGPLVNPVDKGLEVVLVLCVVASLVLARAVESTRITLTAFVITTLLLTSGMALLGLLQALQGVTGRVAVLGGGPNIFGRMMALLTLGILAWSSPRLGPMTRATLSIPPLMLLVLSGSRGAMVAFLAGSAVLLALRGTRARVAPALLLISAGGGLALIATPLGQLVLSVLETRVVSLLVEKVYTSGRDTLYEAAADMIRTEPLLGRGLAGFSWNSFTYPHNILLELWVEGGVIAALLFVCYLLVAGVTGVQHARRTTGSTGDHTSVAVAMWVAITTASQFSGDLFDARGVLLLPLLWLPLTWSHTPSTPRSATARHVTPRSISAPMPPLANPS